MKKLSFIVLGAAVFLSAASVKAQTCPNLNFSYGTLANWQCYSGSCAYGSNSINPTAAIPGRHTIMDADALQKTGQFYDEECPMLPKVPDGFNFSCKIGNSGTGSEVDAIEYEMVVDSNNSLLMLYFAFVLQKAGHGQNDQPQFSMTIKDSLGNPLNDFPCGIIDFNLERIQLPSVCSALADVSPWVNTAISLESLIGQRIKIYLEVRDCTDGNHFGYAYVVADCRPMRIDLAYCNGDGIARMVAPEGFVSYEWTRSSHTSWRVYTRTIYLNGVAEGEIFTCKVTSILGCQSQVKIPIVKTRVDAAFKFGVKDANGHVDFAAHDTLDWYDTCSRTVTFVDFSEVSGSRKDKIRWEIHGLNVISVDSMFTYTFPNPVGNPVTYLVRLTVIAENGCADTSRGANRYITIYPSSVIKIDGPSQFCEGKTISLVKNAILSEFTEHRWSWIKSKDGSTGSCNCDTLKVNEYGTYYLQALGTNGCYAYDTLVVTQLKPAFQYLSIKHIDCWGNATGEFRHDNITGGSGTFDTAIWTIWDNVNKVFKDSNIISKIGTTVIFRGQIAGKYAFYGVDSEGCVIADTIVIREPDSLYFSTTTQATTCDLDNGEITFEVIGGTPPYTFSAENINTHEIKSPTNLFSGTYIAKVADSNGCIASDTVVITAEPVVPLTSISLSEHDMTINYLNQSKILSVAFNPADACNKNVVWLSRDENIARVNAGVSGTLVKALSYGETYVVVTSVWWGFQDSCKITVSNVDVPNYELEKTNYVIYPNPTTGKITIRNEKSEMRGEIEVFDVVGRKLLSHTPLTSHSSPLIEIDISHLASGLYFLKVDGKTVKVVKQ
ncbi:MAG: T9SS type A sorting domain-containing protein [Lentimicrobiaceae bacterium]|nr:T9SS type A sorting domain-containing protein [Lentimicrobiaceae bacterium]